MTVDASVRMPAEAVAPGFVELHGGGSSVVLIPALGGKIRDITLAGRQWLWHHPDVPFVVPADAAAFRGPDDCGGFDDCLPTLSECLLPTWVQGVRTRHLPDHGELWSQQPSFDVAAEEGGPSATCRWTGAAMPYEFRRTVSVRLDGSVMFTYLLANAGTHRMPFLWAAYPVLPLTEQTRIVLPGGARTRIGAQYGIAIGRPGSEHRWPRLRVGGNLVDLSHPASAQRENYACKLFVDLARADAVIALEEQGVRLEMRLEGGVRPCAGLWIDRGGGRTQRPEGPSRWNVLAPRSRRARSTIVLGPCLGAPDNLSEALGAWDDAHWIEPGATATWTMTWRGTLAEPLDGA